MMVFNSNAHCAGGGATRGFVLIEPLLVAAQPRHIFRNSARSGKAMRRKVSGLPAIIMVVEVRH